MRNRWRVLAFDLLAPAAVILALVAIGVVLAWPLWWVSVCSVLVLLVVEGVAVNAWLFRRDAVTVGTDDDAPALRLAIVALGAVALCAAVVTAYLQWTLPDRTFKRDTRDVVRVASDLAEALATFTPNAPTASLERATALMVPDRIGAFKDQYAKSVADLSAGKISTQASTLSAGVEALGSSAASVAVILRVVQEEPGKPSTHAAPALRVTLSKSTGTWLVVDVSPLNSR